MTRKNNVNFFPPETELEKICEEMSSPNYPRANLALSPNATPLERSKYSLCKKILIYKQDKKLSAEKLAQKINLTVPETEDILFARINKFTLDRLVAYADNLFSFQLEVNERIPRKSLKSSVKIKKNISFPRNNSKSKSIHLRKN
jgi:predicted XRE-type DNA-binding protein